MIPHDTWDGKEVTLKGTSDVAGDNIEYTWDFGDGGFATGTVTNGYAIEARHAYTGVVGDIFTARLTVQNTDTGEIGSATYFVEIREKTLETEVNVAIDEGLWYLHKTLYRQTTNGIELGSWSQSTSCSVANPLRCASNGHYAITPANLNAFAVNGHVEAGDPDNPYTETVARGMRWLFGALRTEAISSRTYPAPTGTVNPDSNGNGYGVRVNQGSYPYQGGFFIDAIIAAGDPDRVTTTGAVGSGTDPGIQGRRYADIVQDMVDSYAYGQYNANSAARGGWRYRWNQFPDNSASQWAAIGLIPAERVWGLNVPDWVKTENEVWLGYSQALTGSEAGRFGYTNTSPSGWGPYAVTPSGMVQMVMDGIGRGDQRWDLAETWIRDRFGNDTSRAETSIRDYYYGLFSFTKAMLLHDSDGDGEAEPITLLQSQTQGVDPIDWYSAEQDKGDSIDGVARTLVDDQEAGGYWYSHNRREHNYEGNQYSLETAFAVIMLKQTLFQAGSPVAVAQATPNPGVAGGITLLDARNSFHQDANRSILSYEWDLDDDGVFDVIGPTVEYRFPGLGDYPVTLRISDDSLPVQTATTTIVARIDVPPLAPTADAGGPYVFCPGQGFFLDGTGSVNPDEGQSEPGLPGDSIVSYAWELTGNAQFDDASGAQPNVTGFFTGLGVGKYLIQLRVTDRTATAFPSSGEPDLSDADTAQVFVRDASDSACTACVSDLSARAKRNKVGLQWSPLPEVAGYDIFRSTQQGGPYSLLASTEADIGFYLDDSVLTGTVYYYVVRPFDERHDEVCQSNESSALPQLRTRGGSSRNLAPVITSIPSTFATEGLGYSYQAQAQDPNGDILSYALDLAPQGMTIGSSSGLIQWVPEDAQVGDQNVTLRVQDPGGLLSTQSFMISVIDQTDPPEILSSPVTEAEARVAYSYQVEAVDPDLGDSLDYTLTTAPDGMTIDAASGLVSWTPHDDQVGSQLVTVRATDTTGLFAEQSFTIQVVELNEPPSFTSSPVVEALEGSLYAYDADANDPNTGDTLTFSLDEAPSGMDIDPASGLIQWTPSEQQVGFVDVLVRVGDAAGLSSTQSYQVAVLNQNDPPSITSTPVTSGDQDGLYVYQVAASDQDQGDVLTFKLTTAPTGMTINPTSGRITWTPGNEDAGSEHAVAVQVRDSGGATAAQSFVVTVLNVNDPPVITSAPIVVAGEGVSYAYDVEATDPDIGDSLTFSLQTPPDGMTIDPSSGLISWTPASSQAGVEASVSVRVTDAGGLMSTQDFSIAVASADDFIAVPDVVGSTQTDAEIAIDDAGLSQATGSTAFDAVVPVDHVISQTPAAGTAVPVGSPVRLEVSLGPVQELVPSLIGLAQNDAEASLADANLAVGTVSTGNSNSVQAGIVLSQDPAAGTYRPAGSAVSYKVSLGPDNTPPTAAIESPATGSSLSGTVEITGTADDDNLRSWRLEYSVSGSDDWVGIAEGDTPVSNGLLGRIDAGILRPDIYRLRLTVADDLHAVSSLVEVQTNDQRQLGQFELVYEDLRVPNLGLPIVLRRVYDSSQPGAGDFGRGWRLALTDLDIREDEDNNVFITLPDGRRKAFGFTPTSFGFPFNFLAAPGYTAPLGVYDRLDALDCGALAMSGGRWFCFPGPLYDPDLYRLTTKEGLIYTVSESLGLQRLEDRKGHYIEITNDGILSSSGRNVTFDRDAEGRIIGITDANGNQQHYVYDDQGRLIEHVDRNGNSTQYDYLDNAHLLSGITTPDGCQPVRNEYTDGRLSARIDEHGNVTTYTYDATAGSETVTDANGEPTTYFYDGLGNTIRVVGPLGSETLIERDADGNETRRTDPSGRVTEKTYDANGNQRSITVDPAGLALTSTWTYNAFGQQTLYTDPEGNTTTYSYDSDGNLLSRVHKDPAGAVVASESFTYDSLGNRLTHTHEDGSVTSYTYDSFGNILTETPPDRGTTTFEYDVMGNRTALIDPLGNRSEFSFDALGNPTGLTHGGQAIWSSTYDEQGRYLSLTDANGEVTRFSYDCVGNLTEVQDALNQETEYSYDSAGNLIATIDALDNRIEFDYDAVNRQIARIGRDGRAWGFDYSPDGLIDEMSTPNGDETRQTYDAAGRIIERVEPERTIRYSYDGNDRLLKSEEDYGGGVVAETTWSYDAQGQVLNSTDRNGRTLAYTRNERGDRLSMTTPDGLTTTYVYDGMQQPVEIATGSDGVSLTYDEAGNLIQKSFTNGAREILTYDSLNRLTGVRIEDSLGQVIQSFDYTLDGNGQRTAIDLTDGHIAYGQDALYRLTSERISSTSLGNRTSNWSYDAIGNRTDSGASFADDGRIKTDGLGFSYVHDDNGNRVQKTGGATLVTYGYDSLNRLTTYDTSGMSAVYGYDYVGRRDYRAVNGTVTQYLYDRQNIVAEYDDAGSLVARYTHALGIDTPLMVVRNGRTWFYHTDGLGSVVAITDDSGAAVQRYGYDAWGNLILNEGDFSFADVEPINRLTFTGREYDAESGLYYFRARSYDPQLGRFLQKDPQQGSLNVPQSQHPYSYVRNNPVNLTDPMGEAAMLEYGFILTAPTAQEQSAALVGFMHGFGATNITFIGHFMELSTTGNFHDISQLWDEATARTERSMDELKSILGVAEKTSSKGGVGSIPGAFLNGAHYELGVKITILGHGEKRSIEDSQGGFKEGVDNGLAYLRSLRPH
ncbi:putative Ig domain-containing protein [Halochromatium glycolicum]|uniref:putative Ig domain-containing protein n=1 Tax=Halochromatium glycolicum TaxID=85075 RepID=UPI001A935E49|nr:putative Ig domain-containing protein [Halochromatium glycolicum]